MADISGSECSFSRELDVHLESTAPEVDRAVEYIFNKLLRRGTYKTTSTRFLTNARLHLKVVLLNLFKKYFYDPKLCTGYSRRPSNYNKSSVLDNNDDVTEFLWTAKSPKVSTLREKM